MQKILAITIFGLFAFMAVAMRDGCDPIYSPGVRDADVCHDTYLDDNDWLPEAYRRNADCACSTIPMDSDTAACIREFLSNSINDESKYSSDFKDKMMEEKEKYEENKITGLIGYKAFIADEFVPKIYKDHQDAYKQCCCEGEPAAYPAWIGVATVPMPTCGSVKASILLFGSCGNKPGKWE